LIPVVAISPILLYIGMLIGAQAFQETPKSHAPAIILALTPHLAAWGKLQIDNSLAAAGTSAASIDFGIKAVNGKSSAAQRETAPEPSL
jgi:AGZA family xanthine/uracil permease-like MFS transporter